MIVQDAVRPCTSDAVLSALIEAVKTGADGAMPVLSVRETIYQSADGRCISGLLERDSLYIGQAPEIFRFGKYYAAHQGMSSAELGRVRGSSEIAHRAGMDIRLIQGSASNYKITTPEDLERFRGQMERREGEER